MKLFVCALLVTVVVAMLVDDSQGLWSGSTSKLEADIAELELMEVVEKARELLNIIEKRDQLEARELQEEEDFEIDSPEAVAYAIAERATEVGAFLERGPVEIWLPIPFIYE
ncbi:hypothetical protein Bbelb_275470 [Branchiostoma belcheri]|nr:hypothetical protein Bbelb_275470 [Branchiostoma belcheri]